MSLFTVRRKAAVLAGCAALLGSLAAAPASADSATYYRLTITDAYIVDIQGTVDPNPCAEVYGHIRVAAGEKKGLALPSPYFIATRDHYTEVCEPNRPLNEGKQVGIVRSNQPNAWAKRFNLEANQKEAFRFWVKLSDHDPVGSDDVICDQKSDWITPHDTRGVWICKGPHKREFNVEYTIDRVNARTGN